MAYTTIDDPSAYFKVQLYTGTGSSNAVTFNDTDTDMQPDFVIIKDRDSGSNSYVTTDAIRGVNKILFTDSDSQELTDANRVSSYNSDGFTVGTDGSTNTNTNKYVAWCWKESATAGFDIVAYAGSGSQQNISHSLSAVPETIFVKNRTDDHWWNVYHQYIGNTKYLMLNENEGTSTNDNRWGSTTPTSSVFTVKTANETNKSSSNHIAYCFAPKQGFSKFGYHKGNGNADGTYIHLGFKAALIIFKNADGAYDWQVNTNKTSTSGGTNVNDFYYAPNTANAEGSSGTAQDLDFLANGVKFRGDGSQANGGSVSYVYMAWAEAPFVNSKGVPCNAR